MQGHPAAVPVRIMVIRGIRRRCGRCGAKVSFIGFRLAERCSRCGYRFAREEGFFTGVYLINYSVTAVVLVGLVFGWMAWSIASDGDAPLWPVVIAALSAAVLAPILFYRRAATTWAAVDLALRPLEPVEEAEAAIHASRD